MQGDAKKMGVRDERLRKFFTRLKKGEEKYED